MKLFAFAFLSICLSGITHAQVGQFDRLVLDGGASNGVGTPFISMDNANRLHLITGFPTALGMYVNNGYKFQIEESARDNMLVLKSDRAELKRSLIIKHASGSYVPLTFENELSGVRFRISTSAATNGRSTFAIGGMNSNAFVMAENANRRSVRISDTGIGFGTLNDASAPVHVFSSGQSSGGFDEARILVENANATTAVRDMFELVNNGGSRFTFTDTSIGSQWSFSSNGSGAFAVSKGSTGGTELLIASNGRVLMGPGGLNNFDLRANGNLFIKGTLSQSSDKNMKTAFRDVSDVEVLKKVAAMPVQTWQFKHDEPSLRHIGPTAQDFRTAFGLGENDTTIAPVDGIGVSLAAIKALKKEVDSKNDRIEELESELNRVKAELAANERRLDQQSKHADSVSKRLDKLEKRLR